MKQISLGITTFLLVAQVQAFVSEANQRSSSCPKVFSGVVTKVDDFEAPFVSVRDSLVKVKVHFKVTEVEKGDVSNTVSLDVLKYGPHKFKKGETVKIGLQDKWICSVAKVGQDNSHDHHHDHDH